VRRRGEGAWLPVEQAREFADALDGPRNGVAGGESATVASRLDPGQLHQVGVRGLVEDLLAALDSTLTRLKLSVAVLAGLVVGVALALLRSPVALDEDRPRALGCLGAALVAVAFLTVLLAQMTFAELTKMRPARWADGLKGMGAPLVRVGALYALVGGSLGAVIALLRWLPGLVSALGGPEPTALHEWATHATAVLALVVEAGLWPFALLLLLLGALTVVERCPLWSALWQWLGLLRRHPGRLLLAEVLAVGVGLMVVVPLALPVAAVCSFAAEEGLRTTVQLTRVVLAGVVCTLLLAYLAVANVFIYLEVRYELGGR
jgi:hypothetical protein